MAFAEAAGFCIYPRFCKFHRVVRDIRLSAIHSSQALFLKATWHNNNACVGAKARQSFCIVIGPCQAQVLSNYLWCVNKRPFGTGLFQDMKRRLLDVFLASNTRFCPLFQQYGHLIAKDLDMNFENEFDQQLVWDALSSLPSFQKSGEALRDQHSRLRLEGG
jgi:hypothetical protein